MAVRTHLLFLLVMLAIVAAWSAVAPHDYLTWALETFPVFIALGLLLATYASFPLTDMAYVLIALHGVVLLVGGHYTYAEVPAFNWLRDEFHLSRNHYDRVGHFVQGFVPAIIGRELLLRTSPLKPGKWLFAIIVLGCTGISALYELLEWQVSVWSKEAGNAFLATQGDIWDTQKDMALALIGAVSALLLLGTWHDRQLERWKKV